MKQSELPKFTRTGFEPGYSYKIGSTTYAAPGRFWGLGEDGRLYQFVMNDSPEWEMVGEP